MATIKVKFRASTAPGGYGTLYYQIIHNRLPRQIATGYRILPEEWDRKLSIVRLPADDGQEGRSHAILAIRQRIHRDMEQLGRIIARLDGAKNSYTTDTVVEMFRQTCPDNCFCTYIEKNIIRLRRMGKHGTADNYSSALNSFRHFLASQADTGPDIHLGAVTSELMERYQAWQQARDLCMNTISFYLRILRAVYRRAVEEEMVEDRNPFRRVYTGVDKTVKRALPLPTLRKIKNLDLTAHSKLEYARDMFLMSFYLRGMSFIDMCFLRKTDLRDGYVSYCRRKTHQRLTVAWTAEMQHIVDKYPANQSHYLLPILTGSASDERRAYKKMGSRINNALRKVGQMAGETVPLTLYRARHSWGSLANSSGVPLNVISQALGHDNEHTTRIYLASLENSVVDNANRLVISLV